MPFYAVVPVDFRVADVLGPFAGAQEASFAGNEHATITEPNPRQRMYFVLSDEGLRELKVAVDDALTRTSDAE
jgi:hypothetical protein